MTPGSARCHAASYPMSAVARAFPGSTPAVPATTLQVTPCQRLQERFPAVPWQRPLANADTRQVFARHCVLAPAHTCPPSAYHCVLAPAHTCPLSACHCEERSDVAIRSPCSGAEREAILWANTKSITNLPEQQSACQVFLRGRGLPHQCAHWFAMTCRRQRRVSRCKNVGRNDMQKAEALLRLQGRFPAVHRQCPGIVRTGGKFLHVIARSEATWQSVLLAVRHDREQLFPANT